MDSRPPPCSIRPCDVNRVCTRNHKHVLCLPPPHWHNVYWLQSDLLECSIRWLSPMWYKSSSQAKTALCKQINDLHGDYNISVGVLESPGMTSNGPYTSMCPDVGCSCPARHLRSVVFPAPASPTLKTNDKSSVKGRTPPPKKVENITEKQNREKLYKNIFFVKTCTRYKVQGTRHKVQGTRYKIRHADSVTVDQGIILVIIEGWGWYAEQVCDIKCGLSLSLLVKGVQNSYLLLKLMIFCLTKAMGPGPLILAVMLSSALAPSPSKKIRGFS